MKETVPFLDFFPPLLAHSIVTIEIALGAAALALSLALVAGLARLARSWAVRATARVYIEFFRGSSALVQLFWLFFVLPHFGILLEPLTVGIVGLGLNGGAYGAEIVRGAVLSVARGQYEAATALNMSRAQAMRRVILPQAFVAMMPPFGN
ncbi:MAG: amino acid ABC transporter permease, partial [Alphaproteobacteria bacterium]